MPDSTEKTLNDLIAARFAMPSEVGSDMPAEGTLAQMLRHRTHRAYADKPVDDGLVQVLLACALSTPSKSDLQQVSIVRVTDRDLRTRIGELIPDMPWIIQAPEFFVFCGDSRRIRRICELREKPFANDHLDAFLNAASDAAMALQAMIVAAEAAGLGCCPISVIRNHIDAVAELLNLPDWVFPLAGLCVGYPVRQGFISVRIPPTLAVHTNRYDDDKLVVELDAYDRRRDGAYRIPPEKQRMLDAYGEVDFYGWSEDKARQVSVRERDGVGPYLRRKGFKLD